MNLETGLVLVQGHEQVLAGLAFFGALVAG
jgi:hypothetical protein